MVRCTIKLGNSDRAVYQAGQTMTGLIHLHLDEPKKVRGLYFVVYGAAECDWVEKKTKSSGENHGKVKKMVHFAGKDLYLNTKSYLLGSSDGETIETLARGTHKFEFSFQLPSELPASFETSHGHINYHIETGLDSPWGFDEKFKTEFTVVRCDDLNLSPELVLQTESEEIKNFCRLFCKSKPLVMTVSLPQTGYVPGETIKVSIKYVNHSQVDVHSTRIDLLRIICLNSQTPISRTKIESEKIIATFAEGVERLSRKEFTKCLVVPRVMLTSNKKYCGVVQVSYELKVRAEVNGFRRSIEVRIPITIGLVPLVIQKTQKPTKPISLEIEDCSSITTRLLDSPPPSFDEAIKMKGSHLNQDSKRSKKHQTVFRWNVQIEKTPSEPGPSYSGAEKVECM